MIQITTRRGKGSPLSSDEMDANFTVLRDAIVGGITGIFIRDITQSANGTITFEFSDGSTQGPITLPRQPVRFRGAYTSGQIYEVGDLVHSPETVFIVTVDHVGIQLDPAIAQGRIRSLSGIPDTPDDGRRYVRKTGQWVELPEPAPAWGLPTDHDASNSYPRFSVVAKTVDGVEHLFVAMAAIEANGAVPGAENGPWRRVTV